MDNSREVAIPESHVTRLTAVYGIDIGKNIFHVVGLEETALLSKKFVSGAKRCCCKTDAPVNLGVIVPEWVITL